MAHPFDEAIRLQPLGDRRYAGSTHPGYLGMVAPYGGVTAAQVLQSVLIDPGRLGDPLALTVNYAAALRQGPFEIATRLVRATRTTQHWSMELSQGETGIAINAVAVFAIRRDTFSHTEATAPDMTPFEQCERTAPLERMPWFERYDIRHARGRPLVKQDDSLSHSWVRDDPPRPLDHASLASICDVFFPRIFMHRPTFVPIGTVSMNIYFHAGADELARVGERPLKAVAHGQVCDGGFFDHQGQIWSGDHELLATTHQIIWHKE